MFADWLNGQNSAKVSVVGFNSVVVEKTVVTPEPLVLEEGSWFFNEAGEHFSLRPPASVLFLFDSFERIPALGAIESITVTEVQRLG